MFSSLKKGKKRGNIRMNHLMWQESETGALSKKERQSPVFAASLRREGEGTQKDNCWGFPGGSVVKNLPANARGMGWIPGLGRSYVPRGSWAHTLRTTGPVLWSPEAAATEACMPWSPCSQQGKPLQRDAHAVQLESRQALLAATRGKPAAQQWLSAVNTKLKERKVTDEYYLSLQFASFYSVIQDMEQGRNTTWAVFRGRVWQLGDQCCI